MDFYGIVKYTFFTEHLRGNALKNKLVNFQLFLTFSYQFFKTYFQAFQCKAFTYMYYLTKHPKGPNQNLANTCSKISYLIVSDEIRQAIQLIIHELKRYKKYWNNWEKEIGDDFGRMNECLLITNFLPKELYFLKDNWKLFL